MLPGLPAVMAVNVLKIHAVPSNQGALSCMCQCALLLLGCTELFNLHSSFYYPTHSEACFPPRSRAHVYIVEYLVQRGDLGMAASVMDMGVISAVLAFAELCCLPLGCQACSAEHTHSPGLLLLQLAIYSLVCVCVRVFVRKGKENMLGFQHTTLSSTCD